MVLPGCVIFLFYIKPQLVGRFDGGRVSCVIFLFYIKPQPAKHLPAKRGSCVIFLFYIKPQPDPTDNPSAQSCVIFLFYIKPQPCCPMPTSALVVLYFYSTSNHNVIQCIKVVYRLCYISILHQTTTWCPRSWCVIGLCYISILHQTTTETMVKWMIALLCYISILHQTTTRRSVYRMPLTLCYISILHQTTTLGVPEYKSHLLCYISILHQTTTLLSMSTYTRRCVIFLFYIKPQRRVTITLRGTVVLYFYSTSNHNNVPRLHKVVVVVLYFYSTSNHNQMMDRFYPNRVVLYFYSTSNHNSHEYTNKMHELCYISILHQTTTPRCSKHLNTCCVIFLFYIKPQLSILTIYASSCCVIFLFYIKPQLRAGYRLIMRRLCCKSVARKCACAIRRSGNDAIISILFANVSKKFQLLRHVGLFPFDLAPEIANLAVLLVRDAQHAGVPRRRHRFAYPFDMYRHILLGCAMSYINRVLHHGKTVFLQRLAKQSRMTSLGLCIGRQVEEYE